MRRMNYLLALALVFCVSLSAHQDPIAVKYANTITQPDMKSKLSILASDEFGGRETGTEGQKKAADYLENFYKDLGLVAPVDGTYRQKFNLYRTDWSQVYLKTSKGKQMNGEAFVFSGYAEMAKEMRLSTVFVGKGSAADLEKIDVSGKGVVTTAADNGTIKRLREAGAKAIFAVASDDDAFNNRLPRLARARLSSRLRFEEKPEREESIIFFITQSMAGDLMNSSKENLMAAVDNPSSIKARTTRFKVTPDIQAVPTENMMAFLPGTDLKDEILVVSSHFDHIGTRADGQINNGADDDGSGTTGVMEIAEAFVQAAKDGNGPRRSVLFLNVTGEEKGLLGSAYYSDHPIFPLEKTVNDLNIDMIGRVDPAHANERDYIYVIGSEKLSSHLKIISEYANITYTGLKLDYKFDDPKDPMRIYYRSDHYNFAKHGIPIIFYFNGTHPDYHRPTDTIDKIEFDVMEKRAKLVFHTAWILANRDERTPVDRSDDMDYTKR